MHKIAYRQPPWLLGKAVEPFEAYGLHPAGGAADVAAEVAEADADAHPPGGREARAGQLDEEFLLGGAEGDVSNVGSRRDEVLDDFAEGSFVVLEAYRRAGRACDMEVWGATEEDGRGGLRGAGCAAEKVDGAPALGGGRAEVGDQIGTGDALRQRGALEPAGPDERHAVGDNEAGLRAERRKRGVRDEPAEEVEVGGDDPAAAACVEFVEDVVDALAFGDGVERNPAEAHHG